MTKLSDGRREAASWCSSRASDGATREFYDARIHTIGGGLMLRRALPLKERRLPPYWSSSFRAMARPIQ